MAEYLDSLFKWLQTFHLPVKPSSLDELMDGVICAQILNHICADFFRTEWLARLATGSSTDDWRTRESNWRKIIDQLDAFYEEMIGMHLVDQVKPALRELSMHADVNQLALVLRLILGAAVNCETREKYIQNIFNLDVIVQQQLMEAIQELMQSECRTERGERPTAACSTAMFDSLNYEQNQKELQQQLSEALERMDVVQKRYEALQEKNYELEQALNDEYRKRRQLSCENDQITERLNRLQNNRCSEPSEDEQLQDQLVQRLQARLEQVERELLQTEMQREECALRVDVLEKELATAHATNDQLMRKVKEAEVLKDELDVHRHSADKIANYEQKLDTYKQKLEELLDQRKQFKMAEEKNQQLLAANVRLESELKKANAFKVQINEYKKQVQELHQQVLEKTHLCDKSDFELQQTKQQVGVLLQEKERLSKEKIELKSRLNDAFPASNNFSLVEDLDELVDKNCTHKRNYQNLGFEISSQSNDKLKEQIDRLEQENRLLREKLENDESEELVLLRSDCEDSKVRVLELEQTNRNLNKKIIELEAIANQSNRTDADSTCQADHRANQDQDGGGDVDSSDKVKQLQQTVELLNQQLASKQEEINEIESKYRTYIERAKKAVNVLEPLSLNIQNNSTSGSMYGPYMSAGNYSMPVQSSPPMEGVVANQDLNVEQVQAVLAAKEAKLAENERQKAFLEFENRLMTTAFHKFAFDLQRKAATQRVQGASSFCSASLGSLAKTSSSNSINSTSGSLLNKHRQATSRKFTIDRFTNILRRPSVSGSMTSRRSSLAIGPSPLVQDDSVHQAITSLQAKDAAQALHSQFQA